MLKKTYGYKKVREWYYAIKEWDVTKENLELAKTIRLYKNIHKGQTCVIIGNGPSLKVEDLNELDTLKIPTFACNRVHLIFDKTSWRPTYYFISDEKIAAQFDEKLDGVPEKNRFFPKRYRNSIKKGVFYNDIYFEYEKEGRFSYNAAKGIYPAGSVTTEMIQFAYYMGFTEIYLIGVDFSYAVTQKVDEKTYSYQGEDNYFIKGYLKPGEIADMPNIKANLLGFEAARRAIEGKGKVIKNATRGGRLEVFERINLDDLFMKWRKTK